MNNKLHIVLSSHKINRFTAAPERPQTRKTLEGEKRSVLVNTAKTKVPTINPNCTIDVRFPNAETCKA